jgi:hypothetical protein
MSCFSKNNYRKEYHLRLEGGLGPAHTLSLYLLRLYQPPVATKKYAGEAGRFKKLIGQAVNGFGF